MADSPTSNLGANTKKTFKTYDTTSVYQRDSDHSQDLMWAMTSEGAHQAKLKVSTDPGAASRRPAFSTPSFRMTAAVSHVFKVFLL